MAPFNDYDRSTKQLIFAAFDAAWAEVNSAPLSMEDRADTRTRLTRHLLDAAEAGERDLVGLKLAALEGV